MSRFVLILTLIAIFFASPVLEATSTTTSTPFRYDPVVDTTTTVGLALFSSVLGGLVKPTLEPLRNCTIEQTTGLCDASTLNALDGFVGKYSRPWQHVSDVVAYTTYSIPLVVGALDYFTGEQTGTFWDWGTDVMVIGQSVIATILITDIFKYAVRRPRPTQYTEGAYSGSSEHSLSFPSGHTSSTAAAAFAYASTFALRYPDSPWRYGMWGMAAGLSVFTGIARVEGGMHFYSDVLAGLFLGASLGISIPYFYRKKTQSELSLVPVVTAEGGALGLSGVF